MGFTTCTASVNVISLLDDQPNDVTGLTASELKAKFDQAGLEIKSFINNTLITELDRPTSGVQYYVNGNTGSDANDGLTSGTAFKTINKAISKIPKTFDNTNNIIIESGTYTEDVDLTGYDGGGELNFYCLSSYATVNSVTISNCFAKIVVQRFISGGFDVNYSNNVLFSYCQSINSAAYSFTNTSSNLLMQSCVVSNKTFAIYSDGTAITLLHNVSGSGNSISILAVDGAMVVKTDSTSPDGSESTSGGGMILNESIGTLLTNIQSVITEISVKTYGAVGDGSTDDYQAFIDAIAQIKANGGGTLLVPYTGNGYAISDQILIDFSDIEVRIEDTIQFTKTDASSDTTNTSFHMFKIVGTSGSEISNIKIIGSQNRTVLNGNGNNAVDFVYGSIGGDVIRAEYVDGLEIRNIHATYGLVCCVNVRRAKNVLIENCEFSHSQYDNGFQIAYTYTDTYTDVFSEYSRAIIRNCYAHDCVDLGFTVFIATDVTFEDCVAYNCGNLSTSGQVGRGGGYSVECYNHPELPAHTRFFNCQAIDCIGRGWVIQSSDVYLDEKCKASGILHTGDAETYKNYGNGVTCISRDNVTIQGTFENCESCGIAYTASGSDVAYCIDNFIIKNITIQDVVTGIFVKGVSSMELKNVTITGCTADAVDYEDGVGFKVYNYGANYNEGGGTVTINDIHVSDCDGAGIHIQYVDTAIINTARISNVVLDAGSPLTCGIGFSSDTTAKLIDANCLAGTSVTIDKAFYWNTCTNSYYETVSTDVATLISDNSTNKYYRTYSGSPLTFLTPLYPGEEILDTSWKVWYKATGTTNTDWQKAGEMVISTLPTAAEKYRGASLTIKGGTGVHDKSYMCLKGVSGTYKNYYIPATLNGSTSYNPPSISSGSCATTTVSVNGAVVGDFALASFSLDLKGITLPSPYVYDYDLAVVAFVNNTGGAIDLSTGTVTVMVVKNI